MTRGIVLFAFNSPDYNYYEMAEFTAKRANYFLDLPVTIVTDKNSVPKKPKYKFDNTILVDSDANNTIHGKVWINKGRYRAYELSPYDETILLDADYVINSKRLLDVFKVMDDFAVHEDITYLMSDHGKKEYLSENSLPTLWATVVAFKKTNRVKQIFDCLKMVQENYIHYANIHNFPTDTYRNDFGLTLAWRMVNGHFHVQSDIIPWNLMHIGLRTQIYHNSNKKFNTAYTVIFDRWKNHKIKKEYINIKDMDFHVINKDIFVELIK